MDSHIVSLPPASFGAHDKPACPLCGGRMSLSRREPHPEHRGYELQTFECSDCRHEARRSADGAGKPHA